MQALYRSEVVDNGLEEARRELGEAAIPKEVRDYASRLLDLVSGNRDEIDRTLRQALTRWDLKRLAVIDRCVLRIGVAELLFEPDVPTRVALDEAIEMAKEFGSSESGRFVNGVLDRVARDRCGEETA